MDRQIIPYRRLSAGGIVGFHAPYFLMPDQKYSKEQLEGVTQTMRMAILGLLFALMYPEDRKVSGRQTFRKRRGDLSSRGTDRADAAPSATR